MKNIEVLICGIDPVSLFSGIVCDLMWMDSRISLWWRWGWWSSTLALSQSTGWCAPRRALPVQRWLPLLTPPPTSGGIRWPTPVPGCTATAYHHILIIVINSYILRSPMSLCTSTCPLQLTAPVMGTSGLGPECSLKPVWVPRASRAAAPLCTPRQDRSAW